MKLLNLLFVFSLCSAFYIDNPKSFKIIGKKRQNISIDVTDKLELAEIKFKNTTNHEISLCWNTKQLDFPDGWDFSMCAFGKCQVGIPKKGSLKSIAPGKNGFIAIHVFPKKIKGEGVVEFELFDSKNPQKSESVIFNVRVN